MASNPEPARTTPRVRRFLLGGLAAGALSALLANVVATAIQSARGEFFPELTPVSVTVASLVPSLAGAAFYGLLAARWPARAKTAFVSATLLVAGLDTLMVALAPPHPGFGWAAQPLHAIVALVAIVVIPRVAYAAPRASPRAAPA